MIKDLIRKFKTISSITIGAMSIDAYRRTVESDAINRKLLELTDATNVKAKNLEALESNLIVKEHKFTWVNTKVNAVQSRIMEMVNQLNKNKDKVLDLQKTEGNDTLIESVQRESLEILGRISTELTDLESSTNIDAIIKSLPDSDNTSQLLNNYLEQISATLENLSTAQLGAFGYIMFSVGLYYCVISIGTAYYSDMLIKHWNLENKYPRLNKWLKYRRSIQHYTIASNLLFILFIAGYMAYVNISIWKYI